MHQILWLWTTSAAVKIPKSVPFLSCQTALSASFRFHDIESAASVASVASHGSIVLVTGLISNSHSIIGSCLMTWSALPRIQVRK